MLFNTVDDLVDTEREAVGNGWKSRRFLVAEDGLPFSVHETTVAKGTELRFKYKNHSETVYCIEGKASVQDVAQNKILLIQPGTFYSVGIDDDHILRIEEDTKFLCIFDPPLKAREEAD